MGGKVEMRDMSIKVSKGGANHPQETKMIMALFATLLEKRLMTTPLLPQNDDVLVFFSTGIIRECLLLFLSIP